MRNNETVEDLLKKMRASKDLYKKIERDHPELFERYNLYKDSYYSKRKKCIGLLNKEMHTNELIKNTFKIVKKEIDSKDIFEKFVKRYPKEASQLINNLINNYNLETGFKYVFENF